MAPNAEEELLVVKPWGPQPEKVNITLDCIERITRLITRGSEQEKNRLIV